MLEKSEIIKAEKDAVKCLEEEIVFEIDSYGFINFIRRENIISDDLMRILENIIENEDEIASLKAFFDYKYKPDGILNIPFCG